MSPKHWTLLLALASIALLLVSGKINSVAGPATTIAVPPPTTAPAFAAMAYYQDSCARCHGPQGTFYGPTLGQKLTDAMLLKVVNDMATGPGNAPLTPDQLPVETAFHRALILRQPFVSVTQINNDGHWTGEAMPDANVTLLLNGKTIEASHDDLEWTANLPAGTKLSDVTITAELQGVKTTLHPAESMFSNSPPLPPPPERQK